MTQAIILCLLVFVAIQIWVILLLRRSSCQQKKLTGPFGESETLHRSLIHNLPVGFVIIDAQTRAIEHVNDHVATLFGGPAELLVGQRCHSFLCPAAEKSCPVCDLGQTVDHAEKILLRKDGSRLPVLKTVNQIQINGRNKLLECFVDISQQKRVEEELKIKTDLAESLRHQSEEASKVKSEFLANMSHEIRTPMNGVLGMTEMLLDTDLNEEQKECAITVKKSAEALLGIINDILDFSKIEAGKLELEEIDFDLHELIDGVLAVIRQKVHSKQLELLVLIEENVYGLLKGDPGRIRQILLNFLSNALKFTHKGEIYLHVSLISSNENASLIKFAVKDTGIGISEKDQARLFQSFQQVDSSTCRKFGGTGLGLAISKRLAELMHGSVGLESQKDCGSTFWFTAQLKVQHHDQAVLLPVPLNGVRIIAVDDNHTNLEILKNILKPTGCILDVVDSPKESLHMMLSAANSGQPYSLAILDYMMPEMDGKVLGETIRSYERLKSIFLVLMTSAPQRGDGPKFKQIGFSAYLPKPSTSQRVIKTLELVLGRSGSEEDSVHSTLITQHTLTENAKKQLRILIAEDNPINLKVIQKMITNMGYSSKSAENGRVAIEMLSTEDFDLVLMDGQMPEMDGYEATKMIRDTSSSVRDHNIHVIAITANAMSGDEEKCLAAGMNGYISKPIKRETLQQALRKVISTV